MTTVIFVRHGQSEANKKHLFAGHFNAPLTEQGEKQAECTAEYLKQFNIDVLYASDLDRAYNTAVPISKAKKLEIIKNPRLREIFAGEWEGMHIEQIAEKYPAEYNCWREDIGNAALPDGESVKQLSDRICGEVMQLIKKHNGQTICIATHATPIRVFECFAKHLPLSVMKDVPWVTNASVSIYEYDGDFKQILRDENSFQGDLASQLSSRF